MLGSDYARLRATAALFPHGRPVRWRLLPLRVRWQPKIVALSRVAAADARLRAEWKEGGEKGGEGRKGCINVTLQSAPGAACGGQQPCPETRQQVSSNIPQSESGPEEEQERGGGGRWGSKGNSDDALIITVQFELYDMSLKGRKQASLDPEI